MACGVFVVAAALAFDDAASRADPPPPGAPFATSQPSITRMASSRFVMAFDDESGAFDVDASGKLVAKPHPTFAGFAFSDDSGRTWTRESSLPTNESCAKPPCVRALLGDVHVVSPPYPEQRAFFFGLASTTGDAPEPEVADAIAASFSDDGLYWAKPLVFTSLPGGIVDKFSVDVKPLGSLAAAFVSASTDKVWIATIDGLDPEQVPIAARLDEVALPPPIRSPILRRTNENYGYLAYLVPRDGMGALADLVVMRTDRIKEVRVPGVSEPVKEVVNWMPRDVIFHRDSVAIDPLVPGGLGRKWRDAYPLSFELGNFGKHLYVAFREIVPDYGRSIVVVYECNDDPVGACLSIEDAKGYNDGWVRHEIDDCTVHGSQYQPTIAASEAHAATVAFYQRLSADPSDPRVALMGSVSKNDGDDWSKPVNLRGGLTWTPCPSARGPLSSPHTLGDHFAGWVDDGGDALTAFVDSTTCEDHGEATYDQHVATVTW